MALGEVIHVKWICEGKVYTGGLCTVQGIMRQLGDTGSALATLAITLHIFSAIIWGTPRRQYFTAYSIHWCWIGNHYKEEQFVGQYMWIWFTLFTSFLPYTSLVLWARAILTGSQLQWWKFQLHPDQDKVPTFIPNAGTKRFIVMILYPFVLVVITLPLSVVRWLMGSGSVERNMPAATFAVEYIYSLSRALNVLLFLMHPQRLSFCKTVTAGVSELWVPESHLRWSRTTFELMPLRFCFHQLSPPTVVKLRTNSFQDALRELNVAQLPPVKESAQVKQVISCMSKYLTAARNFIKTQVLDPR
ncbi:hypothetical protein PILCRDRAFT_93565 [Piloderma croceum F 1598]|uniref:Glucose receptor Git3 N-terminal domain-containing protein n=1 Tax=Piloderma croceum (strain F 1598) TaxID=765440 RepID=A0A0C3AEI4_PILCF|nr:hypothetical protein PILCRDRAFT_93565 [Piloderma croceum F 1598]